MKLVKTVLRNGKVIHVLPQEVDVLKKAGLLARKKDLKKSGTTKELKDKGETK